MLSRIAARERVVGGQRGPGVAAREVRRAGVAGGGVAVGILGRDCDIEGAAGRGRPRRADLELAHRCRVHLNAGLATDNR